jgi:hypothetical protein
VSGRDTGVTELRPRMPVIPLPNVSGYLLPGEEVQYADRKHPIVLLGPALLAFAIFVVAGFLVTATGAGAMVDLFAWIVVGALGWFTLRVLRWSRTVLVVTSRRVLECQALMIRRAALKPVFRQGIVFRQDPLGRRLNYGTILTRSPTGDPIHVFKWIQNPRAFYQALTDRAH